MRCMNDIERKFAEEHIGEVDRFLRSKHLSPDEFYDIVIFGFLEAVVDYLAKAEQDYDFSAFAWQAMKYKLCDYYRMLNRKKRKANVLSLDANLFIAGTPIQDIMEDTNAVLPDKCVMDQHTINCCTTIATNAEKQVLILKSKGYTYREIGELCGISDKGAFSRIARFRRRVHRDLPDMINREVW